MTNPSESKSSTKSLRSASSNGTSYSSALLANISQDTNPWNYINKDVQTIVEFHEIANQEIPWKSAVG